MADFVQPYPDSQTTAKELILRKKQGAGYSGDLSQIDAYKRNQLLTLFSQELYSAISNAMMAGTAGANISPFQK
jgi:hypothetical protein